MLSITNQISAKRVLVVTAHPDDEVLGCGGTIARLTDSGSEVHLLILGEVTTSRTKLTPQRKRQREKTIQGEAEKASNVLGIASLARCRLPDNRFDTLPLLYIVREIEEAKGAIKPELVLTHDHTDLNIDHRITHQAVLTAFRPDVEYNRFQIITFEILSSTEWQDNTLSMFQPNLYIDTGKYIFKKLEAMRCYRSELRPPPHPRSIEGIQYLAHKRGMEVCLEFAEAFRIVRSIW